MYYGSYGSIMMQTRARRHGRLTRSTQHGVDMNTSLLTHDGFPRSDIDVAQSTNTSSSAAASGTPSIGELTNNPQSGPPAPASSTCATTTRTS